jgi:hypothetical protein
MVDVDAAIDFHTKHLGFTLRMSAAPAFADVARGQLRLLLSGPKSSAGRPMPDGTVPAPGRAWTLLPNGRRRGSRRPPFACGAVHRESAGARVVVTISASSALTMMQAPPAPPPPPPPPPSLVRTPLIASQARPVRSSAASHIPDRPNATASNPGPAVLERPGVLPFASHSAVNSATRPCTIARIRSLWPDAKGSDVKTPGASATGPKEMSIIFSPLIPRFGVA